MHTRYAEVTDAARRAQSSRHSTVVASRVTLICRTSKNSNSDLVEIFQFAFEFLF